MNRQLDINTTRKINIQYDTVVYFTPQLYYVYTIMVE